MALSFFLRNHGHKLIVFSFLAVTSIGHYRHVGFADSLVTNIREAPQLKTLYDIWQNCKLLAPIHIQDVLCCGMIDRTKSNKTRFPYNVDPLTQVVYLSIVLNT